MTFKIQPWLGLKRITCRAKSPTSQRTRPLGDTPKSQKKIHQIYQRLPTNGVNVRRHASVHLGRGVEDGQRSPGDQTGAAALQTVVVGRPQQDDSVWRHGVAERRALACEPSSGTDRRRTYRTAYGHVDFISCMTTYMTTWFYIISCKPYMTTQNSDNCKSSQLSRMQSHASTAGNNL